MTRLSLGAFCRREHFNLHNLNPSFNEGRRIFVVPATAILHDKHR
jgi:hypothetical protein